MIPWPKLPKEGQMALLAIVVLYGSSRFCCLQGPIICDPPPPPHTPSPMICDPPPPPLMATPSPTTALPTSTSVAATPSPMICDPPPPPPSPSPIICDPAPPPMTSTPEVDFLDRPTEEILRRFQAQKINIVSHPESRKIIINAIITDLQGNPLPGVLFRVKTDNISSMAGSSTEGARSFTDFTTPGEYEMTANNDDKHVVRFNLKVGDEATIEWREVSPSSRVRLPLEQFRQVEITWREGFTFAAESGWKEARYYWSVSGGSLSETEDSVTWSPPREAGRYLLQVVADWGRRGLAIDHLILEVEEDGSVVIC
jgi:hypothetical protein